MILKSTWTRLNSQLSLIKNCLGFRWCKDPRWPHSQLWLQLGSVSPPSLLMLKVFPPCSLFAGVHRFSAPPKQEVGRSITPLNIQTPCAPSALHRGHRCPQQQQNSSKGLGEAENSSNKSTQQQNAPEERGEEQGEPREVVYFVALCRSFLQPFHRSCKPVCAFVSQGRASFQEEEKNKQNPPAIIPCR